MISSIVPTRNNKAKLKKFDVLELARVRLPYSFLYLLGYAMGPK